jgi:hypothetical protein
VRGLERLGLVHARQLFALEFGAQCLLLGGALLRLRSMTGKTIAGRPRKNITKTS